MMAIITMIYAVIHGTLLLFALISAAALFYKAIIIEDIVWPIQDKWKKWRGGSPPPRQPNYIVSEDVIIAPNIIDG